MKKTFEKVIITDGPATWPQNDIPPNYTVCHTDEDGDKSLIWFQLSARIKKGEQLGAWWWLKPIDLKQTLMDFHIGAMKHGLTVEGDRLWEEGYLPKIKEVAEYYYANTFITKE